MENKIIMAFETSCDETSISIVENGITELSTVVLSQIDIHKNYGGVIPEIASRNHVLHITQVVEEALEKANLKMEDIDLFAATYGPGLIGSLLVGLVCAKTLARIYNKPLIPVHHIAGHIYANNLEERLQFPLLALVVSGGHTELIIMDKDYSFNKLGSTLDDAVGEAYDKVARVIELPYPGGPEIDKLAKTGNDTYDLPLPLMDNTYNFSFSGLKSAVINLVHNELQRGNKIRKEDLACSFQNRIIEVLTKKTFRALKEYNIKNLIIAGGVSANKGLREELTNLAKKHGIKLIIPKMEYCTDNAAMIGSAAYYAYLRGDIDINIKAQSTTELK